MTFKEKLAQEHPERITEATLSGCKGCPSDYGYVEEDCRAKTCVECWNREIPMTPEEQEQREGKNCCGCYGCFFRFRLPDNLPCTECKERSQWVEEPATDVDAEAVCKMPLTEEEQEKHDLAINAEIIRGYCGKFTCGECPAGDVCRDEPGMWSDGWSYTSAKKQRSMLDSFEAALPVEEDMTCPVRRRIPESVRDLIDSRIISIDNQIKFLQAERQELVDFWNGK